MFLCPVVRLQENWVEGHWQTCDMQQEGVAFVLLARPASPCHACAEAPVGESTVMLAVAGAEAHRFRWSSCGGRAERGLGGAVGYENNRRMSSLPTLAS